MKKGMGSPRRRGAGEGRRLKKKKQTSCSMYMEPLPKVTVNYTNCKHVLILNKRGRGKYFKVESKIKSVTRQNCVWLAELTQHCRISDASLVKLHQQKVLKGADTT